MTRPVRIPRNPSLVSKLRQVAQVTKAAAPAGSTGGESPTGWGAELVTEPATAELLNLLRARTVLGRLEGIRRVPFRTPVVTRTGGGIFSWTGPAGAKAVSVLEHDKTTLVPLTASGIIVLTKELLAAGEGEEDAQRELQDGLVAFHDSSFIDPTEEGTPGSVPASITSGATAIPSSGSAAEDVTTLAGAIVDAIDTLEGVTFIMSSTTAFGIATTTAGAFPQGVAGGLFGISPVLLSAAAEDNLVAIHGASVLLAEGALEIESARHAALQLRDDPAAGAHDLVSLWQTNSRAIRVEREIAWELGREGAVQVVTGASYGLTES